jgi:hypothetical protein
VKLGKEQQESSGGISSTIGRSPSSSSSNFLLIQSPSLQSKEHHFRITSSQTLRRDPVLISAAVTFDHDAAFERRKRGDVGEIKKL